MNLILEQWFVCKNCRPAMKFVFNYGLVLKYNRRVLWCIYNTIWRRQTSGEPLRDWRAYFFLITPTRSRLGRSVRYLDHTSLTCRTVSNAGLRHVVFNNRDPRDSDAADRINGHRGFSFDRTNNTFRLSFLRAKFCNSSRTRRVTVFSRHSRRSGAERNFRSVRDDEKRRSKIDARVCVTLL